MIHKSQVIFKYEWTFFKNGNETVECKRCNINDIVLYKCLISKQCYAHHPVDPELITLPALPTQNENFIKTSVDSPEKQ